MGIKSDKCKQYVSNNYYFAKKLEELGLTENYMGYYYLVDIMDTLINKERVIRSFSKEIYPDLAKKYDKNACTVERDIRNIINVMWSMRLKKILGNFWSKPAKPSCCEFIYIIKNYILASIS